MTALAHLRPLPMAAEPGAERDLLCDHYEDCLDVAVKRDWRGFTCTKCSLRGRVQEGQRERIIADATREREERVLGSQDERGRRVEAFKSAARASSAEHSGGRVDTWPEADPRRRLLRWARELPQPGAKSPFPFDMKRAFEAAGLQPGREALAVLRELVELGCLERVRPGWFSYRGDLPQEERPMETAETTAPPVGPDELQEEDDLTLRAAGELAAEAFAAGVHAAAAGEIEALGAGVRLRGIGPTGSALERARELRRQQEQLVKDLFSELAFHDGRAAEIREVLAAMGNLKEEPPQAEDRAPVPASRPRRREERGRPTREVAPAPASTEGKKKTRLEQALAFLSRAGGEGDSFGNEELATQLGISTDHANVLLRQLVDDGAIRRVKRGIYVLARKVA